MPSYDEWKLESGEVFVPDEIVEAWNNWERAMSVLEAAAELLMEACASGRQDGYDGEELGEARADLVSIVEWLKH